MELSIITAVHNRAATIESALHSVQEQSYPRIQHVVIDGASTDGTLEILRRHGDKIDILISEPDQGLYDALNKGLLCATGDFVGVLHSDDRFKSSITLEMIASHLEEAGTDSVYGDLVYTRGDQKRIVRKWVAGPYDPKRFRTGWMPPHPTFFIRRSLVARCGGYDSRFGTAADYEFLLRYLYRHQVSVHYIPKVLVEMSVGGLSNAALGSRIEANRADREAWRANGLRPSFFFRVAKPGRKLFQYRWPF